MSIREWLWGFLPDQCEVQDCCRKGMRGNENIIYPWPERYAEIGIVCCDYCNSKYMNGELLWVHGNMPMVTNGKVIQSFDEAQRRTAREKRTDQI